MAGTKIRGITIELGADASGITKALKGIDSQLASTQKSLKDINKLLKLDPGNVELLTQKQKNLESAISLTKERLEELKTAQSNLQEGSAEWDAVQREIIANEQSLKDLEQQYKDFGSVSSQQIKAVGQKMTEFGGKIESAGQKLSKVSGAAAALGGAMLKLGYDTVQSADELKTLSQQTGISTDELQKMQYAAELVDVSVEDITGAMRKLKTKIDPSNESLKKFGISALDSEGNLRDANYVFYDALLVLSQIENETERDQAAMELFGKSADSLAGIIDDGGAGLRKYGKEAEDLGLILDGDTIDALNDTNDTLSQMKGMLKGSLGQLGATIAKVVAPAVEKLSKKIGEWTEKLKKLNPKTAETILKIVGVVAAIAPALIVIGKLVKGIGGVISIIGTVVGVLGGPLTIAIVAVIAIGVLLYKNWDTIKEKAIQLKNKVVEAWTNLKTSVINTVNNLKTAVTTTWNNMKAAVVTTVTNVKTSVVTTWNNMKTAVVTAVTNLKTSVTTAWTNLKTSVTTAVTNLKTSVTTAWDNIKSKITGVVDSVKGTIEGLKEKGDSLKTKFNDVKDAISSAWDSLKEKISGVIETVQEKIEGFKEKFDSLKEKVTGIWDSIKEKLETAITLPKIPLPHFTVSPPGWKIGDLLQGTIPSLSISWYKKAYDNPVMFTSPTVMATPGGLKGFGDGHGAEIVMGLNKLQELVGSSRDVVINVYSNGTDVDQLADAIQARFVALNKQRRLAHA